MISLATLPTATAQEVFDQSALHLLTQNQKANQPIQNGRYSSKQFVCKYRLGDLKCAAGCFISDEEYSYEEFEFQTWGELKTAGRVPQEHHALISALQNVHDNKSVEDWKKELAALGLSLGLCVNVVNQ